MRYIVLAHVNNKCENISFFSRSNTLAQHLERGTIVYVLFYCHSVLSGPKSSNLTSALVVELEKIADRVFDT